MQNAWVVAQETWVFLKRLGIVCTLGATLIGSLTACGQKGPLYLPQQQTKPQPEVRKETSTAPARSTPAETPAAAPTPATQGAASP